jgi:uncharacterized membrane protein
MTFSIKRLKEFKLPVFMIGLMPMSLHQAASFSYDSFIHGVAMLFTAYAVSCIYERDSFKWRDFAALLVTGILLAPAKVVYLPIIVMVFIAAWRWKDIIGKKAWLLASAIFIASTASAILFTVTHVVEDFVGENVNTWTGVHNYTLSFVLENPFETLWIFARTLYHNVDYFTNSMFGKFLAGLTISLPVWITIPTIVLIFISIVYGNKEEWQPSVSERIYYFLICAVVVFLVLLASFIGWTTYGFLEVAGVQGRYFIPILPLALLLLRFKKILIPYDAFRNGVIVSYLFIQSAVILFLLDFTIGRYG